MPTNEEQGRIPETTLQCIRHLRQVLPRATISVEVEKPGREGLVELANAADVVFYSRGWAEVRRPAFPFSVSHFHSHPCFLLVYYSSLLIAGFRPRRQRAKAEEPV